jgi:3-hydroxyacyl-[acyl-carrier-protein] dehydratase
MWQAQDFLIPRDHPTAAGHFPTNPIVPGALLLDAVVAAIAGAQSKGDIVIRAAKFLQPVRHGAPLQLRWQAEGSSQFRFQCFMASDGALVFAGTLAIEATS